MKFNDKDFRILECSQPNGFGYLNDNRALELMDLGYLIYNPKEKWYISGYKTTEKGKRLYLQWLKEIRENHGHVWETYEDYSKRDGWYNEGDTYTENERTEPYSFAYSEGYHNGYKCKNCGFEFCTHCYNEWEIPKCSEKNKNITMSDDSNLDQSIIAMNKAFRNSYNKDYTNKEEEK